MSDRQIEIEIASEVRPVVARAQQMIRPALFAGVAVLVALCVIEALREPGTAVGALILGVGLAVWGTLRIVRDPRRVSNAVILLAAVAALTVWVLVAFSRMQSEWAMLAGVALCLVTPPVALLVVGVGLLVNGVVVTRREGVRIATLTAPVVGVGLLAVVGALYVTVGPVHLPIWVVGAAMACLLLGLLVVVQLVAFTVYAVLYGRLAPDVDANVIVALGCGLAGDRVTPLLASRLDRTVAAYDAALAAGANPTVVVSGGQGPGETVPEADAMADYLVSAGLPDSVIVRERCSRNTDQNLRLTRTALREHGLEPDDYRFTVVTSDFHVMRSAELTRRVGMNAHVVGARTASYFVPTAFLREFVGVLAMHRRGNLVVAWAIIALVAVLTIVSYLPIAVVRD
ncbi:YdcF family protein [Nocardia callitridis]|uniref:YdcF family protein n=1 Tax=Nocardia callitridis TaxID=648753 RepID=A0ABP9KPM6_9NOCA